MHKKWRSGNVQTEVKRKMEEIRRVGEKWKERNLSKAGE